MKRLLSVAGFLALSTVASGFADTIPPVIHSMSISQNGNGSNFRLVIDATDNVGIDRVEIYLDGNIIGTPTQQPAPVLIRIRGAWEHVVEARVFDAAGNMTPGELVVQGR